MKLTYLILALIALGALTMITLYSYKIPINKGNNVCDNFGLGEAQLVERKGITGIGWVLCEVNQTWIDYEEVKREDNHYKR